jgi:antitoxin ParD1/3/4
MTKFANIVSLNPMTTMNVSLPDELKVFVDERVIHDGYGSTSEYVRDLIRRDRERGHLRDLVLEGANSGPGVVADTAFFDALRQRISSEA